MNAHEMNTHEMNAREMNTHEMNTREKSTTQPDPPLLEVDLSAGYTAAPVLNGVRFTLEAGDALGLVGSSGAGKSTLLLAILGLLGRRGWMTGSVRLRGQQLNGLSSRQLRRYRGREIALIPQSPMSSLSPVLRIGAHFREAWLAHQPRNAQQMQERVREVLEAVQLPSTPEFLRRRASQISVGQGQRVLVALALLHRPSVIVADEPTSALDPVNRMELLRLLESLRRRSGLSLLYISHDMLSVLKLCNRVAVLDAGRIVETFAVTDAARAQHPTTNRLFSALPVPLELLTEVGENRAI